MTKGNTYVFRGQTRFRDKLKYPKLIKFKLIDFNQSEYVMLE